MDKTFVVLIIESPSKYGERRASERGTIVKSIERNNKLNESAQEVVSARTRFTRTHENARIFRSCRTHVAEIN